MTLVSACSSSFSLRPGGRGGVFGHICQLFACVKKTAARSAARPGLSYMVYKFRIVCELVAQVTHHQVTSSKKVTIYRLKHCDYVISTVFICISYKFEIRKLKLENFIFCDLKAGQVFDLSIIYVNGRKRNYYSFRRKLLQT